MRSLFGRMSADLLPNLIWHLDEPIADSAFVTTFLVAVADQSVKVILSGVGGDELFGGYRRYLGDAFGRYYRCSRGTSAKMVSDLLARLPQRPPFELEEFFPLCGCFC